MMDTQQPSFRSILYRTIISHTVTYFGTGVTAAILLGYTTRMIRPDVAPIIRKITDPILIASPLFQPFRAALLAIVFYLLRDVLFSNRKGWLIMWLMLVVTGILAPFAAIWGGIEGMIFSIYPYGFIQPVGRRCFHRHCYYQSFSLTGQITQRVNVSVSTC
jgi:hypothetical protein